MTISQHYRLAPTIANHIELNWFMSCPLRRPSWTVQRANFKYTKQVSQNETWNVEIKDDEDIDDLWRPDQIYRRVWSIIYLMINLKSFDDWHQIILKSTRSSLFSSRCSSFSGLSQEEKIKAISHLSQSVKDTLTISFLAEIWWEVIIRSFRHTLYH